VQYCNRKASGLLCLLHCFTNYFGRIKTYLKCDPSFLDMVPCGLQVETKVLEKPDSPTFVAEEYICTLMMEAAVLSRMLVPICQNVGTYLPECWYLSARMLVPICQNVDTYLPECWYLSARMLVPIYQNVGTYLPECWYLSARIHGVMFQRLRS
jgi:hypothetical protein